MAVEGGFSDCPQKLPCNCVHLSPLQLFCFELVFGELVGVFTSMVLRVASDRIVRSNKDVTQVLWTCGKHANVRVLRLGIDVSSLGSTGQFLAHSYLAVFLFRFFVLVVLLLFVVDFRFFRLLYFLCNRYRKFKIGITISHLKPMNLPLYTLFQPSNQQNHRHIDLIFY